VGVKKKEEKKEGCNGCDDVQLPRKRKFVDVGWEKEN
jgi:hypothetical protein